MFIEYLPEILTGLASIVALVLNFYQYTKNKMTDFKIEKWKKEEHESNVKKAGDISQIYGELWELLYFLNADRVYLIQPHPLYREMYVSATLEVRKYGISSVRDSFNNVTIESVSRFVSDIASTEFIYVDDIETSDKVTDDKVRAIMMGNGCYSVALRRLCDEKNNWIGTIVVGYVNKSNRELISEELIEKMTRSSAYAIQYKLPEYKTE